MPASVLQAGANVLAVRYAWSNSPSIPGLYSREGLPARPFRTDAG